MPCLSLLSPHQPFLLPSQELSLASLGFILLFLSL